MSINQVAGVDHAGQLIRCWGSSSSSLTDSLSVIDSAAYTNYKYTCFSVIIIATSHIYLTLMTMKTPLYL